MRLATGRCDVECCREAPPYQARCVPAPTPGGLTLVLGKLGGGAGRRSDGECRMKTLPTSVIAMWLLVSQPACSLKPAAHPFPASVTTPPTHGHDAQPTSIFADNIEKGITPRELRVILQEAAARRIALQGREESDPINRRPYLPPKHLFTVHDGRNNVACIFAKVHPSAGYYFVFVDYKLARIVELLPRQSDIITREDGSRLRTWRPISREQRIEFVLESEGLSAEEFVASAKKKIEASRRARRAAEFNPALLLATILTGGADGSTKAHRRRHIELMEKYDATKIPIGMSREQVQHIFGPAHDVETVGDADVVCTYGEAAAIGLYQVPWVSVEIREDVVVSVFTY